MLQFTGSFYTTNKLKLDPMVKDTSKILLSLKSYLRQKDRTTQFRVFGISYSQYLAVNPAAKKECYVLN